MRTARFCSRLSGRAATQRVVRFDQNICDLSEDGISVVFSDVETLRSGQCTVRHSLPTWEWTGGDLSNIGPFRSFVRLFRVRIVRNRLPLHVIALLVAQRCPRLARSGVCGGSWSVSVNHCCAAFVPILHFSTQMWPASLPRGYASRSFDPSFCSSSALQFLRASHAYCTST